MSRPAPLDPRAFATSQLALLAAELAADTASTAAALLVASHSPKTLATAGLAVANLVAAGRRTGLGGKTVLELELDGAVGGGGGGGRGGGEEEEAAGLGEHGVRVGDVVRVSSQPKGGERRKEKKGGVEMEGVVVRVGGRGVQVALGEGKWEEEDEGGLGGRLWV